MRIVAGEFGGRKLILPKGFDVRPTTDKVRGAIFNALASRGVVEEARVLDCFCGTGALGLEAISRGAAHCTFIDKSRTSLDLARENADKLSAADRSNFLLKDACKPGQSSEAFSLIFIDPPYEKNLLPPALEHLSKNGWLEQDAVVVAEVEKKYQGGVPGIFKMLDEKSYGDTKVMFLRYANAPE